MPRNIDLMVRTSSWRLTLAEWAAASETRSAVWARMPGAMDGGRNRIVTRHERWGVLIGCSKWRRGPEGNPRFRAYYRAAQPARFAR